MIEKGVDILLEKNILYPTSTDSLMTHTGVKNMSTYHIKPTDFLAEEAAKQVRGFDPNTLIAVRGQNFDYGDGDEIETLYAVSACPNQYDTSSYSWTYVKAGDWLAEFDSIHTNKKLYIAYDDTAIYGIGETEEEALSVAKSFGTDISWLRTCLATDALASHVDEFGGDVGFSVESDGIAYLITDDGELK